MPRRSNKRPEKVIIRRKCHTCGTMKTDPYVYTTVPSLNPYSIIPNYNKNHEHPLRADLKDGKDQFGLVVKKGVDIKYYCDVECQEKFKAAEVLNDIKRGLYLG
jgi:ribosomal protein L44E